MAAFLARLTKFLFACEMAGELSNATERQRGGSDEYDRLRKDARAFADQLMKVVVLTKERVPSSSLENLLRVTEEIVDQRVRMLHDELTKINAEHDGDLSTGSGAYSLKAAYEKAKAASLEGARLEALCDALCRDTENITALIAEVSRNSGRVLSTNWMRLDQLVQDVSDRWEQHRGGRRLTEISIIPRLESTETGSLGKKDVTEDGREPVPSTSQERAAMDSQERHDSGLPTNHTIDSPRGPQNISQAPDKGKKRSLSARLELDSPQRPTITASSVNQDTLHDQSQINHRPPNRVIHLEQENGKRLIMAPAESDGSPVLLEQARRYQQLLEYDRQFALLERENRKKLMMARQALDDPPVLSKPTKSPLATSPQSFQAPPERANGSSSPEVPRRPLTMDDLAPTP